MKYIIINAQSVETAILFPEHVNHCDAIDPRKSKPISAGFCSVNEQGHVRTFGASTSLKLVPRPQDSAIIMTSICMMGIFFPLTYTS